MILHHSQIEQFQEAVWGYYASHARSMPWRSVYNPYYVAVSELMLQQTQVARVIPKFQEFITQFPQVSDLASAPLDSVIRTWQGLGYNRRAKYLHEAAKIVVHRFEGQFPDTLQELLTLPGVGKNTAGAILAYAYNKPALFIETNIRTVLFHHFYANGDTVNDNDLLEVLAAVMPDSNYREWYWALMDYGSYLKQTAGGRLDQSRHYKKQPPLKGSVREVRGQIIAVLTKSAMSVSDIRAVLSADERFTAAMDGLVRDGLVERVGDRLSLTA